MTALERRLAMLEQLYQRERAGRELAEATLRELSEVEGDALLWRLVAIWRDRAEREGTRRAFAERALRRVLRGQPAKTEVAAWLDQVGETIEHEEPA